MLNTIVNSGFQPAVKATEVKAAPAVATVEAEAVATESTAPTEQREQEAKQAPAREELQAAVSKLNDYVQNIRRTLSFSVEENTGLTVVQVYDSETEELIRQIPAEETIQLAATIEAYTASLFIKEQA